MVLVLIGVMAGVAAPPIGRFLDSLEFKKQTAKIMAAVRYARLKAITEGKFVVMTAAEGGVAQGLLLSGAVNEVRQLELAEDATLEIDPLELVFSPEGYGTPGTFILTSGGRTETIFIDPMTALPLVEEADAR
jgi:Tfp pilus assembly protein FimT